MKPRMIARANIQEIIIGLRPKTLANLNSMGEGPTYYKIGNKVYYQVDELLKWATLKKVKTFNETKLTLLGI